MELRGIASATARVNSFDIFQCAAISSGGSANASSKSPANMQPTYRRDSMVLDSDMRFLILATTMGFLHLAVLAAGGQTPGIPSSGPTKYGRIPEPTSTVKREPSTQAQKLEFRKVFQEYLKALKAFTEAYDASNGDVWPEKEAKALRKAWRAVQKVQPYLSDKADR